MKATNIRQYSSLAARSLIIVGVVMILSSILDFVVLSYPLNIGNREWQINIASQIVDRGIIPMVGMALLFTGYWVRSSSGLQDTSTPSILDLRFWALLLASLLGLVYILIFPVHLNNTSQARAEAIERINQQASQAETQLEARVGSDEFRSQIQQRQSQLRGQFNSLLQDETRLNEALENQQLPSQVKTLLEESKDNPQAIDEFLNRQAEQLPDQLLTRIRSRKQELEEQANTNSFKSSLRTGLSSLLLALGYMMIGWTGLKNMGVVKSKGRRPNPVK
ncbi:HpsJ family protein [Okeania sp.]|uniref:hormogonium polysaccharide biosynthesis protein HpsJ n=1 Tax=Okeania sp. TaxID=3100323 RepID=UPI002B4B1AF6|nr:HpsJ family protein [Okeania sp.]MEB3341165.1 HpsJ family protein [Okeania sp.]